MKLAEAQQKFINSWGSLGSNWGVNRAMAELHALLLISPAALSAEDMMEKLQISRGNVNMNVRTLMDWGLVYKEHKIGERREFFIAEKDIHKVALRILAIRRKRELEGIVNVVGEFNQVALEANSDELAAKKEFETQMQSIGEFSTKVDALFQKVASSESSFFTKVLFKLI